MKHRIFALFLVLVLLIGVLAGEMEKRLKKIGKGSRKT